MRQVHPVIWSVLCLVVLLCSCNHKELVYPTGSGGLTIAFDWTNAPTAQPDGMLLTVFSGTSQPVTYSISDRAGGELLLPNGTFQMVAQNDNTESVFSRGNSWGDYELFAQPTAINSIAQMFAATRNVPRAPGTESQNVVLEPDEMWASALSNIQTAYTRTVTLPMDPITEEYVFTIENVENLENVIEMAATLSGMAGTYYPALRRCGDYDCIIPFPMDKTSGSSVRGTVRAFGNRLSDSYQEGNGVDRKLVVYIMLNDYTKYYSAFDVTEAINEARQNTPSTTTGEIHLSITIDEFVIPEPLTNGSGMHAEVDEWQEINVNIRM